MANNSSRKQSGDPDSVRLNFYLHADIVRQLKELSRALHVSRSGIMSIAISRFYNTEPAILKQSLEAITRQQQGEE